MSQLGPIESFHAVGFDMDHTLVRYKLQPFIKLIYESAALHLVQDYGHDERLLQFNDQLLDFCLKGIFLDPKHGNFLKLAADGSIIRGCHGTKRMTDDELTAIYGKDRKHPRFAEVKDTYEYSDTCFFYDGYYEIAAGALGARLVDFLDEKSGRNQPYKFWGEILKSFRKIFAHEDFKADSTGRFLKLLFANPEDYAERCSDSLVNWLRLLKQSGKKLFVITYSSIETAYLMLDYILGADTWRELFDVVSTSAKKPGFFNPEKAKESKCYIYVDGRKKSFNDKWVDHGIYSEGHCVKLLEYLTLSTEKKDPKVIYFGDSIRADIVGPKRFLPWTCGLISDEVGCEGFRGNQDESRKKSVNSKLWGSFFYDTTNANDVNDDNTCGIQKHEWNTFWGHGIKKYSDFCIPSLQYLVDNPKSSFEQYPPHDWSSASF